MMKRYLRQISPKAAVQDFASEWRQPTPHRWQILGVAMALTFAIFMVFIPKSQRIEPARPDIVYISTFDEGRGDAEIIASNCENQRLQNELNARLEQSDEARRDMYRALGRATFVDVDSMEADIEAERAAQTASTAPVAELTSDDLALSLEEYCDRATG